jgi:hypothetical protein
LAAAVGVAVVPIRGVVHPIPGVGRVGGAGVAGQVVVAAGSCCPPCFAVDCTSVRNGLVGGSVTDAPLIPGARQGRFASLRDRLTAGLDGGSTGAGGASRVGASHWLARPGEVSPGPPLI